MRYGEGIADERERPQHTIQVLVQTTSRGGPGVVVAKSHEGLFFNLKAVVQQTGLKPDTLRAWERRYGVPTPKRSSGGHRIYSQRDIEIVNWLIARQREGLSIKHAVELWTEVEAEEQLTLLSSPPLLTPSHPGQTLSQLREAWIAACLAYDEQKAEQILAESFALYPPETVFLELVRPAIAAIGDGWYEGSITVQQEHFTTALAIRRLQTLIAAVPPPTRPGRILAAGAAEEQHVVGLLLLIYLIRRRGWEVVYLGADVPVEKLEASVATTQPKLVILAAHHLQSAATLLEAGVVLRQHSVPLAYGGLVFTLMPALRARLPGHFLGPSLEVALQTTEALLVTPRSLPPIAVVSPAFIRARDHYKERQGLIEGHLPHYLPVVAGGTSAAIHEGPIEPPDLAVANRELALSIPAALTLGDLSFVETNLMWLEGLISYHRTGVTRQMAHDILWSYLGAYYDSARMNMDERGQPILDWLAKLLQPSDSGEGVSRRNEVVECG